MAYAACLALILLGAGQRPGLGRGARVLAEGFAEMAGAGKPHGAGHFSHRAARRQQGAGGLHAPMRQARVHALAIQMLKARLQPFFIQAHLMRQRGGRPRLAAVLLQQGMGAAQAGQIGRVDRRLAGRLRGRAGRLAGEHGQRFQRLGAQPQRARCAVWQRTGQDVARRAQQRRRPLAQTDARVNAQPARA